MHTPTPPSTFAEVLRQFHANCPALEGAVVASQDGALLAAWGQLPGAVTASAAARLGHALQQSLALVRPCNLTESLLWAPPVVWWWAQLNQQHQLLACCQSLEHAGALRLAGQIAVQQLLAVELRPATPAQPPRS